jgi:hypothetical protein
MAVCSLRFQRGDRNRCNEHYSIPKDPCISERYVTIGKSGYLGRHLLHMIDDRLDRLDRTSTVLDERISNRMPNGAQESHFLNIWRKNGIGDLGQAL